MNYGGDKWAKDPGGEGKTEERKANTTCPRIEYKSCATDQV